MTLLEIMVRDWPSWPVDDWGFRHQRVYQDTDGDLIGSSGYSLQDVIGHAEVASDRATAVVTERQWAAQRAQAQEGAKP